MEDLPRFGRRRATEVAPTSASRPMPEKHQATGLVQGRRSGQRSVTRHRLGTRAETSAGSGAAARMCRVTLRQPDASYIAAGAQRPGKGRHRTPSTVPPCQGGGQGGLAGDIAGVNARPTPPQPSPCQGRELRLKARRPGDTRQTPARCRCDFSRTRG